MKTYAFSELSEVSKDNARKNLINDGFFDCEFHDIYEVSAELSHIQELFSFNENCDLISSINIPEKGEQEISNYLRSQKIPKLRVVCGEYVIDKLLPVSVMVDDRYSLLCSSYEQQVAELFCGTYSSIREFTETVISYINEEINNIKESIDSNFYIEQISETNNLMYGDDGTVIYQR